MNVFTASGFNGNFVFVLVSTDDTRNKDHVPQVRFSDRPDGYNGFRKTTLRPTRRSSLGWLNGFRDFKLLRLRLKENFDRFQFEIHKEKEGNG
jgi:hypothetical protein